MHFALESNKRFCELLADWMKKSGVV